MENGQLRISIITASYNYANLINETIDSIINQTYANWELIIVDDGSTDNSVEVIQQYCQKDSRIKLFQHENGVNKGLPETLQLGIKNTSSDWIAFLESDDVFEPNYLEEKVKVINANKDVGLIFNDVKLIGDERRFKEFDLYFKKRGDILAKKEIKYSEIFDINIIPTFSCVMVKKELLTGCNFNTPIQQCIDWILWSQLITQTKIAYVDKKLTHWRLHFKSYMNELCIEKKNELSYKLFKYLNENKNLFLINIYMFINKRRLEKLLRPQVRYFSEKIVNLLLENKSLEIMKF